MAEVSRRRILAASLCAAEVVTAQQPKGGSVNSRLYTFIAGKTGDWSVGSVRAVLGESLPAASRLAVVHGPAPALPGDGTWTLRGVTSNTRYTTLVEKQALTAKQSNLGRPTATRAALIPIRKNAAWWDLTQDERRRVFEEQSHHTKTGLKYLPAIARRLHHSRDLSAAEPFDFLTWFDFAPEDAQAFEDLVGELRRTEEWKFVEREVDIRLVR